MNTFAALCAPLNLVSGVCCILLVHTFLYSVGYETKTRKIPLTVFCFVLAVLSFAPAFLPKYLDVADTVDMTSTLCHIVYPYLMFKSRKKTAFLWIGIAMVSSLDYLAFILNYAMRLGVIGQLITRIVIYLIIFAVTALIVRKNGRADLTEAFDKFPPVASLMIYAAFLAAYYSVTVSFNAEYTKETANSLTMFCSISL